MPVAIVAVSVAVASAFALSSAWKLSHRVQFESAFYRLAPSRLRRLAQWALWPIALAEAGIAFALVLGIFLPGARIDGDVLAACALALFSASLYRAGEIEDCGCWSMPLIPNGRTLRNLALIRNVVLLALVLGGAFLRERFSIQPSLAVGAVAGVLVGLLVTELPQIAAVASFIRDQTA